MKFRLRAFFLHLLASAAILALILGILFAGWYHWPGWYLADAVGVFGLLVGVDLVVGPLLTLVIASASKPRRALARDVGVIAVIQILALSYGSAQLWRGRVLYFAFSETVLQSVQAYDIPEAQAVMGREKNPGLAPHWYSRPRWISVPLPLDPKEREKIVAAAVSGGDDVISMPIYYRPWAQGLPELKLQLKKLDEVAYFFPKDKKILRDKMLQQGLAPDESCCIPFTGRGHPLLAVFDRGTMQLKTLLRAR